MAPKVRSDNQEVSLGPSVDDGKIVFGVAQYVLQLANIVRG